MLHWTSNAQADSYQLYRSANGGASTQVTSQLATNYTDMGLANGTAYTYTVKAMNTHGQSDSSAAVTVTPSAAIPAAPTGLRAVASYGQVQLTWTPPPGMTPQFDPPQYTVLRATAPTGPYEPIIQTSVTNALDTNAVNGQRFYYSVTANNATGSSAQSQPAAAHCFCEQHPDIRCSPRHTRKEQSRVTETHSALRARIDECGYTVVDTGIEPEKLDAVTGEIAAHLGFDPRDSGTWDRPEARATVGGIEMYHYPSMWAIRQDPRLHQIFAGIHGSPALWVSIDRVSCKLPATDGEAGPGLPLHWDTDITRYPDLPFAVQGVLALADTDEDMGGFCCSPEAR